MSLLERLVPSTFLIKISVLIFFVIFFIIGFILGKSIQLPLNNKNKIIKKNVITPTITTKEARTPYCDIELSLMNKKYNITDPVSLLFAIRIPNFHQDWECYSFGYDEKGFRAYCRQKTCQSLKNLRWPQKPNQEQQRICDQELNSRDYPKSLNNLEIRASEFYSINEIKNTSVLINSKRIKKTPKGINYEFNKISKIKYNNLYSAIFYSPFKLTNRLSRLDEKLYGSDWIYGKYIITTKVVGENIENKVIDLFEKIIDSIIFIKPDNNPIVIGY